LEKVGVNILDANGNLKEMDTILDNIATQWNTLNNAEQVALAQSVAGIRQYNQFLALMGNWDVMEKNVELARDSTGELEK
jgi:TP901 family phage tail tape measure protein